MKTATKPYSIGQLTLAVIVALTSGSVFADDDEQEKQSLEMIVVVGEATNSLVSSNELEEYQANDLSDIFRMTPSVSVGGGASNIAQKIYVRGLQDNQINITVDGAPQAASLFNHIGRVAIDPNLLKEIEVQAGAGEATSGAGAIGGAIRFRTKDVDDLLASEDSFGGNVKVSGFSNDGVQANASLYGRINDNWGAMVYYSATERDNAEDGDGKELVGTATDQSLAFIKVSGYLTDNQSLSLSYEKRELEGELTLRPDRTPVDGEQLFDSEGARETIVANYLFTRSDLLNLEFSIYRTESSFQRDEGDGLDAYGTDITSTGFDLRNISLMGEHSFTYGVDYRVDEVDAGYVNGTGPYGNMYGGREEGSILGLYIQGHSQVSDLLLLSYGARYDDYQFDQKNTAHTDRDILYSTDSADISLNVGLVYDITDDWAFGLGYAEAARGKAIGEGYTVYGTTLAEELESESVANIEGSLEYSVDNFNAKLAVFHSEIDDAIYDMTFGGVYYENIGVVETEGFEFNLAYRWNDMEIYAGFVSTDAQLIPANGLFDVDYSSIDLEAYEYRNLGTNRGDTLSLGLNYAVADNISAGWNMTYVGDLNNVEVLHRNLYSGRVTELQQVDKPGYDIHDIYVEWTPLDNLQLNFAMTNVFDQTYLDHSSVADYTNITGFETVRGYNEPGRNIRLALSYRF